MLAADTRRRSDASRDQPRGQAITQRRRVAGRLGRVRCCRMCPVQQTPVTARATPKNYLVRYLCLRVDTPADRSAKAISSHCRSEPDAPQQSPPPMSPTPSPNVLSAPENHAGSVYELTGPAVLNLDELAAQYSAALGRPVRAVRLPYAKWLDQLNEVGLDPAAQALSGHVAQQGLTERSVRRPGRRRADAWHSATPERPDPAPHRAPPNSAGRRRTCRTGPAPSARTRASRAPRRAPASVAAPRRRSPWRSRP
jgi:hypothetical protein